MTRHTVHFTGRVQGVGFRYTTRAVARGFAVAGYVQNLSDGRVRLVAEGEPTELDAFVKAIVDQMGHYIDKTTVDRTDATGEFGQPTPGMLAIRH
jgi:acylphosphatase